MKFRQRSYIIILLAAFSFIWLLKVHFARKKRMVISSTLELQNFCWPRVHYPRRDLTSIYLYSTANKTFGQRPVYGGDGEADFSFLSELPRHQTPMKVFIVPHSHNDPAWIQTFDTYYTYQSKPILENILHYLNAYPDMTFLWTEPVFLHRFFREINTEDRKKFKRFVDEGRLDIASGGWISPDEATTTHYALISQLTEGLWWLKTYLNYTSETYWNIDPFGYSQTMPYILRKASFKHVHVVRVNEQVKQLLREMRALEFQWSAFWDRESRGIVTNVLPFMLYNIKYSCGPSTSSCLMFDFRRIDDEESEAAGTTITDSNALRFGELLYKQMELKSRMYRHNVLIFPIGDDFRFDRAKEWEQQYTNFKRIFKVMNSKPKWNVEIRFGTLRDYHREMAKRIAAEKLPSLVGDFYPYTDRNQAYWTGYFTTRPVLKARIRLTEKWIRAVEAFNVFDFLSHGESHSTQNIAKYLTNARRDFGFLQHHDAIAGTSKPFVMDTYYEKIRDIVNVSKMVLQKNLEHLTGEKFHGFKRFDFEEMPQALGRNTLYAIVNSKEEMSHECFHVRTSFLNAAVFLMGSRIPCQVNPQLPGEGPPSYEVVFCLSLPGVSVKKVVVSRFHTAGCTLAKIWTKDKGISETRWKSQSTGAVPDKFIVKSPYLTASLDPLDGLPTSLTLKGHGKVPKKHIPVNCVFASYTGSNSGAYIFSPDTQTAQKDQAPTDRIWFYDGPLEGGALVKATWEYKVRVIKDESALLNRAVVLQTLFHPSTLTPNAETVFRVHAPTLDSGLDFLTDANGLALSRRRRQSGVTVQANYQPATSAVVLDDPHQRLRLSLLLSRSGGATSLAPGTVEVMLMRQPAQDDVRGLGEGVHESEPVYGQLLLLAEACAPLQHCRSVPAPGINARTSVVGDFLSRTAAQLERGLNLPPAVLARSGFEPGSEWSWAGAEKAPEFRVLNTRRLPDPGEVLLVVHKPGKAPCHQDDERMPDRPEGERLKRFVEAWLGPAGGRVTNVARSDLTGLGERSKLDADEDWTALKLDVNDVIGLVLTVK